MILAPKRRWLRYSLRTLFVVLMVFCVWLGWCINWIHQRHLIATKLDFDLYASDYDPDDPFAKVIRGSAPWQLWPFGEQGYAEILLTPADPRANWGPSAVISTVEDRDRIRKIFPEAKVEFGVLGP